VSRNITGVNDAAGSTGEAANQVLQATGGLNQQAKRLTEEMTKFLTQVRSAA